MLGQAGFPLIQAPSVTACQPFQRRDFFLFFLAFFLAQP
jgi:hypothetical protein